MFIEAYNIYSWRLKISLKEIEIWLTPTNVYSYYAINIKFLLELYFLLLLKVLLRNIVKIYAN